MKKYALTAILIFLLPTFTLAQQTFNPHTGQWERTERPDTNIGHGGAIDSHTGTHFAPSGDGVVNTKDGTVWIRSGDTLTNTRTGQTVFSPDKNNKDSGESFQMPDQRSGESFQTPDQRSGKSNRLPDQEIEISKEQACINAKKQEARTRERIKSTRNNQSRRDLRKQLRKDRANISKYCY